MLFWPLVLISLVSISLFLAGPPSGAFLASEDAELRVVYLTVFAAGITIACAGRMLVRGGGRAARHAVVWLGIFLGVFTAYAKRDEIQAVHAYLMGHVQPSVALSRTEGEAMLRRGWDGHFRATAEVNGVPMQLMIDTGASMVLLPQEAVADIGINPSTLDYSIPVTTANGRTYVAPVRISSIKIGTVAIFDIDAAVAQPGRLRAGLLGMSFLDRLSETSFRGDQLILRH